MGFVSVALAAGAALLLAGNGQSAWMWLAIAVAVGCHITNRWMYSFARHSALKRHGYRSGFYKLEDGDLDAVPDWLTWLNMGSSVAALAAFIGAAIAYWL